MKKLYLLLTSNLILLTGVGTLTTTVAGCAKEKEEAENPIYKELAKFHKNNPLQIIYDINNPKPKPSYPEVAEKIRYGLKLNNKIIFTDEVTKKITFKGDHNLKIDEAILVNATYEKKQILMYVEEKLDIASLISNELGK